MLTEGEIDIILSLTRTSRPGYLRDIRRLTVALSRARLGLYILGRREVFTSTPDLSTAFAALLSRPASLTLSTGEMFPTKRSVEEQGNTAEMEGVEHLGQYVFEMTKAKVEAIKKGEGQLPPVSGGRDEEMEMEDQEVYAEDEGMGDEEDVEMM
jgi:intron-binding protein aquarius